VDGNPSNLGRAEPSIDYRRRRRDRRLLALPADSEVLTAGRADELAVEGAAPATAR